MIKKHENCENTGTDKTESHIEGKSSKRRWKFD